MSARFPILLFLLLGLQGLDVLVHVATGQFEPLRVASNSVIAIGAILFTSATRGRTTVALGAGLAYIALNALFLVQHGIVNPDTGAVRLPLFGFVLGSLVLLVWLVQRLKAQGIKDG
ncbi:hypothetical protein AB2B41_03475 [Marimonas sp. MJW-29]|uniref:Uncharacterized protein n=1 Tax=Sulfitobacter sediminis TaxID=3234186 RepID=A0ABV3RJ38_9RHOB